MYCVIAVCKVNSREFARGWSKVYSNLQFLMIPNTRQNLVSHLICLTLAYASAECSPFIHLLGTRLTPDAVSQSLVQSDCACLSLFLSWMQSWSVPKCAMEKWIFRQIRVDHCWAQGKEEVAGWGKWRVNSEWDCPLKWWHVNEVVNVSHETNPFGAAASGQGTWLLAAEGAGGLCFVPGFWIPFAMLESKVMLSHFI